MPTAAFRCLGWPFSEGSSDQSLSGPAMPCQRLPTAELINQLLLASSHGPCTQPVCMQSDCSSLPPQQATCFTLSWRWQYTMVLPPYIIVLRIVYYIGNGCLCQGLVAGGAVPLLRCARCTQGEAMRSPSLWLLEVDGPLLPYLVLSCLVTTLSQDVALRACLSSLCICPCSSVWLVEPSAL